MKVTVNIDCTPEEARTFFGLPDVRPMQESLMKEVEEKMRASLAKMEPEAMFKTWFPTGVDGLEQMQKAFWAQFGGPAGTKDK